MSDGTQTIPIYDAQEEFANVQAQGTPISSLLSKPTNLPLGAVNSFYNGLDAARGWILALRSDLDKLNLNGTFALTFDSDSPITTSITWNGLVVCREPQCVTPGLTEADQNGVWLVELSDKRWLVKNPYFCAPISEMYNVSSGEDNGSAGPTTYLAASLNIGTPWTWTQMVGDIWGNMTNQMGTYPGLPVTPGGTPIGWMFHGVSAWDALCEVLARIGCAVRADLTLAVGSQFSIVQLGATDTTADTLINAATMLDRKIHDAEFMSIVRGRLPYGVRVFFHKQLSAPTGIPPWLQEEPYYVDIVGPDSASAEAGVYHPIWDDMPALYDATLTLTNGAALATRAQERADNFYRMMDDGGTLLWQRFSGVVAVSPGSAIRSVTWRAAGVDGIYTDVTRYAPDAKPKNDYATGGTLQDLIRIGFPTDGSTRENEWVIELVDGVILDTVDGGTLYDAFKETRVSELFEDSTPVWAIDLAGSTSLAHVPAPRRYITNHVLDDNGNPVREAYGSYYVSILGTGNVGQSLTNETYWREVVGPISPPTWAAGSYLKGNLVNKEVEIGSGALSIPAFETTGVGVAGLVPDDCAGCGAFGEPVQWSLTLAGITNGGGCNECTLLNATHILTYQGKVGNSCFWAVQLAGGCPSGHDWIVLEALETVPEWFVWFYADTPTSSSGGEAYSTLVWTCNDTNTLAVVGVGNCTGMPATITLEPVL